MRKKKWVVLGMVISILLLLSVGFTKAQYKSSDHEENNFSNGDLKIKVTEGFSPPKDWDGGSYPKRVSVDTLNEDNVKCLIRVSLVPRWEDSNQNPWAGDSSKIEYTFSDYLYKGDMSGEIPVDKPEWIPCKGENGVEYYYYNTIVKNKDTTEDLIENVAFDSSNEIDSILKGRYSDKTLIVDVKAESVIADNDAVSAVWGDTGNARINEMLKNLCSSQQ